MATRAKQLNEIEKKIDAIKKEAGSGPNRDPPTSARHFLPESVLYTLPLPAVSLKSHKTLS